MTARLLRHPNAHVVQRTTTRRTPHPALSPPTSRTPSTSHLNQLDVRVEQVSLGDVDVLAQQLAHQAQDAGGNR